jgi:hypothetical protein
MAPTVASTDPALRIADRHLSGAATAPPPGLDAGMAGAGSLMGDEVSAAVELAVMDLARLIAGDTQDDAEALGTIARVASQLAGRHDGRGGPAVGRGLEEERPVAAAGSWSLSNGMLNVVLGEN